MSRLYHSFSIAVLSATCLVLVGCSTPTMMKLSGTPHSTVAGHYRAGDSSFDVSGAVPLVVEVPRTSLQECQFLKTDPQSTLTLEIRHGTTQILQGTAGPGTRGIKAQDDHGWHFQILR